MKSAKRNPHLRSLISYHGRTYEEGKKTAGATG
jgi:hypothetical protein